jgi:hypothetical protein
VLDNRRVSAADGYCHPLVAVRETPVKCSEWMASSPAGRLGRLLPLELVGLSAPVVELLVRNPSLVDNRMEVKKSV